MALRIQVLPKVETAGHLAALADLRITVFRDWPYLYDGDAAYEARYLATYAASADACIVGAFDGNRLVGAATGSPLEQHEAAFSAPFKGRGMDPAEIYYCAESVLLPRYRGQGAGHAFFDQREAHARTLDRRWSAFCAVLRPDDHPARPAGYRPLDGFWRARGYAPIPDAIAHFPWRDVGDTEETEKPLQFWLKELR
ncbi:MAG: GNAT family N-acetyltransferase [Pseudomonadota bacterium]